MTALQERRRLAKGTELVTSAKQVNGEIRQSVDQLAQRLIDLRAMVSDERDREPINRIIDNIHELLAVGWRIEAQLCQRIEHLLALNPEEDQ